MSNFQKKYKKPTTNFGDPAVARVIRAQKQQTTRKSDRAATFTRNRNVPNASEVGELPVKQDRMNKLLEWKAKRDKQRRIEQMNRKKEFVVRGVSKNIFSLPADNITEKQPRACKISPPKRITKATEKRLLRKQQRETSKNDKKVATKNDKKVVTKNDKKVVTKNDKNVATKNDKKVATETGNNINNNFKSLKEPDQEVLFEKSYITFDDCSQKNSNNSIVETHNNDISRKSEHNDSSNEPAFFSPYVVSSRGKRNARNEEQMKRGLSLNCSLKDNIPTKDTIIKNLNISVEEEERTAQYFHFLLNKEIDRLNELCDKWTAIKEESGITEDGQYHIQQVIGQTTLLMSKKFERFRGLVADCETGKGTMLVTCKDLQGFWDMMYMEIKNCDLRFNTLEQLRSQGWKEEELHVVSKLPKRNKTAVKKKVVSKKASSFRNFIVRRRKERVEGAVNTNDMEVQIIHNENKTERSTGCNDSKPSSVKHKVSKTRSSLLHEVQLLAAKKQRSSLARMKISQIYKTPQVKLDNTIFYINSDQTPKKSILKQPRKSNEIASSSKSVHKVNFDDSVALNEIPISEEVQTKMDLAAALSRIDDLNFNDSIEDDVPVHANLRLTFDDSSSEECKDVSDTSMHSEEEKSTNESINMPLAKVESAETLESHMLLNNSIDSWPRRTLRRQLAIDESAGDTTLTVVSSTPFNETVGYVDLNLIRSLDAEEETHEHNETVKVLRNRSITATNTLTPRRRSRKMSTNKQLEFKENIDSKDGLSDDISTIRLSANSKTKKFKRSIKFSEEKSNIYTEKEVFPTTPHVRSKTQSNNKKKRRTTSENPMSIGSPAPKSTRRSLSRNRVTSA